MEEWKSVQFTTEEDEVVTTGGDSRPNDKFELCLVGSLWSRSSFNHGAFRTIIMQVWKLQHGVEIKEIVKSLFLFQFFHWKDKERILSGELWWFDKKKF